MINTLKWKLLTYLFNDWLYREEDKDILELTREMITEREYELDGIDNPAERTIIQGFKRYDN